MKEGSKRKERGKKEGKRKEVRGNKEERVAVEVIKE